MTDVIYVCDSAASPKVGLRDPAFRPLVITGYTGTVMAELAQLLQHSRSAIDNLTDPLILVSELTKKLHAFECAWSRHAPALELYYFTDLHRHTDPAVPVVYAFKMDSVYIVITITMAEAVVVQITQTHVIDVAKAALPASILDILHM